METEKQIGKYTIEINYDDHPIDPREEFNMTNMFCFHKRYDLGDDHNYDPDAFHSFAEFREQLEKDYDIEAIKPLYMYDHSGITISTSPFRSSWDSGQIGFVFMTTEQIESTSADPEKVIDGEVNRYDQYVRGEVYGFMITDEHGDVIDSCFGFYDHDYCLKEAEAIAKRQAKKDQEQRQQKLKDMIINNVPLQYRQKQLKEVV